MVTDPVTCRPDATIAEALARVRNPDLSPALAAQVAVDHRVIFETLLKREKLGSTGIGQGIAIPHGKCKGVKDPRDDFCGRYV